MNDTKTNLAVITPRNVTVWAKTHELSDQDFWFKKK